MKKLVIGLALFSSLWSFGSNNPELKNEIDRKMKIEFNDIELNQGYQDFVSVSFKINKGHIEIQDINGSSNELKELVITELNDLIINADYKEGEVYLYKFTFKRL